MPASEQKMGPKRQLSGIARWLVFAVAVGLACFHLYTAAFGVLSPLYQRSIHLLGLMFLTFLLYMPLPGRGKDTPGVTDWVFTLIMIAVAGFFLQAFVPDAVLDRGIAGPH